MASAIYSGNPAIGSSS